MYYCPTICAWDYLGGRIRASVLWVCILVGGANNKCTIMRCTGPFLVMVQAMKKWCRVTGETAASSTWVYNVMLHFTYYQLQEAGLILLCWQENELEFEPWGHISLSIILFIRGLLCAKHSSTLWQYKNKWGMDGVTDSDKSLLL